MSEWDDDEVEEEVFVELPSDSSVDAIVEAYRQNAADLSAIRRQLNDLEEVQKLLKGKIVASLNIDDDPEELAKFTATRDGRRLLKVNVFPNSRVDVAQLRSMYPEIYTQLLVTKQIVRLSGV